MSTDGIYNVIKVSNEVTTAGQPTIEQFKAAASEGFVTVINMVPSDGQTALKNEGEVVQGLGIDYVHIPVQWNDPKESDFDAFDQAMTTRKPGKTLIHCAANFRVTAFYSLYAQKHLGWTEAQADEFRAPIWKNSDYPIWEAFITQMKAKLGSAQEGKTMVLDRSFVERNRASTARIRDLVAKLSDEALKHPVGEHWTVSMAFAHLAFWDRRVMLVLDLTERDGKVTAPTVDVTVNDLSLPFWAAIPPREAARLAVESAEALDKRLEAYPPALLEKVAEFNMRWVMRALHRTDHLDEIEATLKA